MASSSNNAVFNTNNKGQGVTININAPTYNKNVQPSKTHLEVKNKYLKNKKIGVLNVNDVADVLRENPDVDQIYRFIHAKGGAFSNFATIPVILSIITSMYKTKKNELEASSTLTNLYSLTLEHVKSESKVERNKQMETKVNKLFYHMLTESRYSFTQNELQKYGLSLEYLKKVTMVSVDKREGSRCDVKNVRITPTHQSVQEYSSAHFIAHTLDLTEFKELVDNKLFAYDLQDQWNMVRRFVSGILANAQPTPQRSAWFSGISKFLCKDPMVEKKNYFMEAYIRNLKAMLSTNLFTNVTGHKKRNLEELQSSLNLDLMEMPNETDSIKSSLTSVSNIWIETRPRDVTMMEGTNFFISQLDPHIQSLIIYLPSNCDLDNFNRMTSSIGKLSKKIETLAIYNINLPFSHVDQIAQLAIDSVGYYFFLKYTSETKVDEMMNIKSKIQSFVDSNPTLETHIQLNHNCRNYILRPQPDMTSLTPSNKLIKQSKLKKGFKEIDLRLLTSSPILQSIIGLDEWKRYSFDFRICHRMEIITFSKLMKQVEMNVHCIMLCLPEDVENDQLELFCQTIARHEKPIWHIQIMNIVWSDLYFDQICKILPNVKVVQLDIMVEVSEDEKEKITTKFRPHVRESCRLVIVFLEDSRYIRDENHLW